MLKNLIKRSVPRPLLKRARASLVLRNRKQISKTGEQYDKIFIEPVNRVEHYFHFLFDLSLPLCCLMRSSSSEVTFVLKRFGIFTERLQELFPGRIEIVDDESSALGLPKKRMLGMNPQFVQLQYSDIASFRNHVCQRLSIDQEEKQDKVILIERMPPNAYFSHEAVKKGAGASRRSIANHDELQQAIQSRVKVPYEFINLQLENVSFKEQIYLFNRARLVIGQHGAGLANCIWMRTNSTVVELTHDVSLQHFQVVSEVMNHHHVLHKTSGAHAPIEMEPLLSQLLPVFAVEYARG